MEANEDRLAEVAGLVERAKVARLDGADMLEAHGLLWCLKIWNGAGPEFLPKRVRARLTDHLAFFAPALLIHDADFALSDGKITTFQAANERLRSNCRRLVLDAHPFFFSLARWKRLALSDLIADACGTTFGFYAWEEAHEVRAQRISQDRQDPQDTQDNASPRPGSPGRPGGPGTPQTKGTDQ